MDESRTDYSLNLLKKGTGIKHGSVEGPDGQLARELHKTGIFHLLKRLGLEGLRIFAQCPGNKSLSFMGILMKGRGEIES